MARIRFLGSEVVPEGGAGVWLLENCLRGGVSCVLA